MHAGMTGIVGILHISQTGSVSALGKKFGSSILIWRYAVAQLVEALCYKPKGHGFDSRWGQWNFSVT